MEEIKKENQEWWEIILDELKKEDSKKESLENEKCQK